MLPYGISVDTEEYLIDGLRICNDTDWSDSIAYWFDGRSQSNFVSPSSPREASLGPSQLSEKLKLLS